MSTREKRSNPKSIEREAQAAASERREPAPGAGDAGPIRFEVPLALGSPKALAAFETFAAVIAARFGVRRPDLEVRGDRLGFATVGPATIAPELERQVLDFSKLLESAHRFGLN